MKTKNLLLLFTRNPELGKVKSRLAKDIGQEKALQIYIELLKQTNTIAKNLTCEKWVFYSENTITNDIWSNKTYQKKVQSSGDLGNRMEQAFKEGFENDYEKIIIIGSDIYDLQQKHIEEAFEKLNTHDVVFGPAEDGGYYLLGMKSLKTELFRNKNWGTETVYKDSLNSLPSTNTIYNLETLNDIDVISDIKSDSYLEKLL